MNTQQLEGYQQALKEVSQYITDATRRNPNNPLAVLNDTIVFVHHKKSEISHWFQPTPKEDEEDLYEMADFIQSLLGNQFKVSVKGGRN